MQERKGGMVRNKMKAEWKDMKGKEKKKRKGTVKRQKE